MKKLGRTLVLLMLISFIPLSHLYGDTRLLPLLDELNTRLQWEPHRRLGVLRNGLDSLVFKDGESWVLVNYEKKVDDVAIFSKDGALTTTAKGAEYLRTLFGRDSAGADYPRIAAILIDPGHGGKDPGTIGRHTIDEKNLVLYEKEIVLDICLDVYNRLKNMYPGKRILLTRQGDTYPSLEDRVEMANQVKLAEEEAIIFVSVHANASLTNKKAKGFEVWYLPPDFRRTLLESDAVEDESEDILPILNTMLEEEYTVESVLLARQILNGMEEKVGDITENRGLKEESWFVVRNAKMPSVLIEVGFVTNQEEAQLLADRKHLMKLSEGIYNGLVRFVNYFERTKGFTE
jgi:N-acetylmuramoyl-L-alanine amidase